MAKASRGSERREQALSRESIVQAALELLAEAGENGLTFRALAAKLETGSGAIYWHIANKDELLAAACDAVVARVLAQTVASPAPRLAIRAIATGVFEAIDTHPWLGPGISQAPGGSATLRIFERLGREVEALGVPVGAQFTAASALLSYILGVSSQNAVNGRVRAPSQDRASFLASLTAHLDEREYPFLRKVAAQLREHDDLAEFLAGIELILGGITASR